MIRSQHLKVLISNEFQQEFKSASSSGSLLLFVAASTLTGYLAFKQIDNPLIWNGIFWLMILFAAVNATSNTFKEKNSEIQYLQTMVTANELLLSKIVFNAVMMLAVSLLCYALYALFLGNMVQHHFLFFTLCVIGSISLATIFSITSGIAYQAAGNSSLFSILSIPIAIPVLILLIATSISCLKNDTAGSFIDAEIYTNTSKIVQAEAIFKKNNQWVFEDQEGTKRAVELQDRAEIKQGKTYQFELSVEKDTHLLSATTAKSIQTGVRISAYYMTVGILLVASLSLLIAFQVFPKFWLN